MKQTALFEEEKEVKKIKLPNEEGFFFLDRIKIKYKFDKEQFGNPHLEFWSVEDNKPNILSDTGYRSWFVNWDLTESVISSVKQLIEMYLEAELKDRKAEYTLEFEGEVKAEKEVENTDSAWNDIHKLTKRCDGKEEFAYLFVDYIANPTLESRNEYLSMSSTHEMPKGELGSSYGSWSWTYDKEEDKTIEKLFEELLDFYKDKAEKPYHKTESGIATTTLSIKNCILSFSKKAKEYLTKLEFDFKKFETEVKKIKQLEATKKDLMKSKTFEVMEKQMDTLRDTCWAIKGYFDECSFLLGRRNHRTEKDYYSKKLEKFKIDTTDLNALKELYNKKAKHYYIFYKKVYFQRWGKQTDDEYCYP